MILKYYPTMHDASEKEIFNLLEQNFNDKEFSVERLEDVSIEIIPFFNIDSEQINIIDSFMINLGYTKV